MPRIIVLHRYYGCETGCCGHVVEINGEEIGNFTFSHPRLPSDEDKRKFAEELIRKTCGEEHVKDLDFENSIIDYD